MCFINYINVIYFPFCPDSISVFFLFSFFSSRGHTQIKADRLCILAVQSIILYFNAHLLTPLVETSFARASEQLKITLS